MTAAQPAEALRGASIQDTCDRCNRDIRTGEAVRYYAVVTESDEWVVRRLWCADCGESTIQQVNRDIDELIGEAMVIKHQLTAIRVLDRSEPAENDRNEHPNES